MWSNILLTILTASLLPMRCCATRYVAVGQTKKGLTYRDAMSYQSSAGQDSSAPVCWQWGKQCHW